MDFENATNATGNGDTGQLLSTGGIIAVAIIGFCTCCIGIPAAILACIKVCLCAVDRWEYRKFVRELASDDIGLGENPLYFTEIGRRPATTAAVIQDDREPVEPLQEISISPESDAVSPEEPADPDPANTGMPININ